MSVETFSFVLNLGFNLHIMVFSARCLVCFGKILFVFCSFGGLIINIISNSSYILLFIFDAICFQLKKKKKKERVWV